MFATVIGHFADGRELRHAHTRNDARRANGSWAHADLHGVGPGTDKIFGALLGDHVSGDDRDGIAMLGLELLNELHDPGGVSGGRIDEEPVNADLDEGLSAVLPVRTNPNRTPHTQASFGVFAGIAKHVSLLDVLTGDQACQFAFVVDEGQLLNSALGKNAQGFTQIRA